MHTSTNKRGSDSLQKSSRRSVNHKKIPYLTSTHLKQIFVPTRDSLRSFREPQLLFDSNAFLEEPYSPPLQRKKKSSFNSNAKPSSNLGLDLTKMATKVTSLASYPRPNKQLPETGLELLSKQLKHHESLQTKKKVVGSVDFLTHQDHQSHPDEKQSNKSNKGHHPVIKKSAFRKYSHDQECPWGLLDVIYSRYQIQDVIGEGSFGTVFKALDNKTDELVAVKVIKNTPKSKQMAEHQIKMLEKLNQRDTKEESGIYKLKNFFVSKNHIVIYHNKQKYQPYLSLYIFFQCLVFELLSLNLYQLLKKLDYHGLTLDIIRKFAIQLLNSLAFLKWVGIIHTDIKPQNIALKDQNKTGIKLLDFGTSIHVTGRHFDYIMSRFYRAPEIILSHPYDSKIDMWSLGCVLAQLYLGAPIFPGTDEQEMINMLIQCRGMPPEKLLSRSARSEIYFTSQGLKTPLIVKGQPTVVGAKPLETFIKDKAFCQFLDRLLQWQPSKRATPQQALLDPWITEGLSSELLESHKKQVSRIEQRLQGRRVQGLQSKRGLSTPAAQKRKASDDI